MKNISVINWRAVTRWLIEIAAMILVKEYTVVDAHAQITQFGIRTSELECHEIQPAAAIPILGHVTHPFYMAASTSSTSQSGGVVTFKDLYNEESITMPSWLWDEVKDLNEQLEARLSASDYLTILKGENRLFAQYKTGGEYRRAVAQNWRSGEEDDGHIGTTQALRKKLVEILANPTSDRVFPRPRFVTTGKQGIIFREYLRHSKDEISLGDESYILTRGRGLQAGYSSLWTFWDSRTGFLQTQFACQSSTLTNSARGKSVGGRPIYYLMETYDENSTADWCHSVCATESYLVDPRNMSFQALVPPGMSPFVNYVEYPDNGLLYRLVRPLPPTREPYSKLHAPWYAEGDAGKEFFHIPQVKDEQDFAWGELDTPHTGNVLFLDSLSQYSYPDKQQEEKTQPIKDKIMRLMQPVPVGCAGDELDQIDIGSAQNGYTMFLRYCYHYNEASSGGGVMLGLLTPNNDVLCFPVGKKEAQYSIRKGFLPSTGKLRAYRQLSGGTGMGIPREYCAEDFAPYVVAMQPSSPEGKNLELVIGVEYDGIVEFDVVRLNLNNYTYETDRTWRFPKSVLVPKWISNHRVFMKPDGDHKYKIIQVEENGDERITGDLYVEGANNYAIVLSNGHYAGSPGCERFLQYGDGERVVGMRALAPWRNRPAEVLEAIGGNADEIAALKETTQRWLRKQGFDPDAMPAEPAIKDFPTVDVQMPALFSTGDTARFTVTARATANDIAKVIVRADGVQIPQSWDSDLSVPAGAQKELTVEVPLASGQNWIEVTPVDSKGITGDTFRFRTIYKGTEKSDLYIIALGVSNYDDPDLQLQYAAKDATDISAALEKYGVGNEKHVLLLTDKQVKDRGVLNNVREFLSTATINDRVVLYVAGHGMLDDRYNYYYAPAGFDPERIAETGITMDELTGCLQDSKARKKLLLLDTCHSGMLGEEGEEKLAMSGVQLPHGVRAIQHRGMKVKKAIGALNTNQKKRYIENLFSRGDIQRGINIIAGAAGAEYALESGEWKNGVFTASIIGAMKGEGAAQDVDGDGFFSVEELQQKVVSLVQKQTGGQQKPSVVSAEGAENMIVIKGDSRPDPKVPTHPQTTTRAAVPPSGNTPFVPHPPAPSYSVGGEDRSNLQPLIDRMAALRCKAASSAMYQRGLLMLLPMIRNGADVNLTLPETMGNTALHYSCAIGSWSITQWLVNHGANVNAVTDKGATPLDCVGSDNGVRIRALLKSHGAKRAAELRGNSGPISVTYSVGGENRSDLQPMINRMAALRCREASSAVYQRGLLMLLPMIRNGADVNLTLPETMGNTALHYSCAIGSWSITQWLVNHGANVNAVTDKGATPLDCVGSDNGVRIRALLKSHGAKRAAELR